jgi:Zn-dependent protease
MPVFIAITLLGDNIAWWLGRVSLNPAKHIDPFGTTILASFLFGYAGKRIFATHLIILYAKSLVRAKSHTLPKLRASG